MSGDEFAVVMTIVGLGFGFALGYDWRRTYEKGDGMSLNLPERCFYCEQKPIALCDFHHDNDVRKPCDRAICRDHCKRVGFVCIRGKGKKNSDTIDYCSEH